MTLPPKLELAGSKKGTPDAKWNPGCKGKGLSVTVQLIMPPEGEKTSDKPKPTRLR